MKAAAISTAFLMSVTSVFAQSATESSGINSALGVAPSTEDFVSQASASDLFEIEASKLAIQKGDNSIKSFAQTMIADHEKTSIELKALLSSGKVAGTPVTALPDNLRESVEELAKLEGTDFNEQYIDDQVEAHENAVALFTRYAEEGENPELKAFATKTLPALQHHYKMAQDMDETQP